MSLTLGTRIGPYEIAAQIGLGGMGEVYRATDTNLKRAVAIKVLPAAVAADLERLARFQREAEVLASLNHPNIASIYGLERTNGATALVMELVEGPTLADRIAQGPMPVNEGLQIAKQVAEALEAAHDKGIIHRDLKPANVKVRPDGTVKVLDFGLAKTIAEGPSADVSSSPTRTAIATHVGVLLGTAGYMSPEQARGKLVDKRTDIWAFGCLLYELITSRRTFPGESVSDTIAAIIEREPDWRALPANAPARLRRLLQRCLNKDPKRRLRDIADAHADIEEILVGDASTEPLNRPAVRSIQSRTAAILALIALVVGGIAGSILGPVVLPNVGSIPGPGPNELRLEIATPPTTDPVSIAISPDSRKLVFVATSEGRPALWLRSLGEVESHPVAGTDDATFPFWSPDSRSVGFFATGQLKRIDLDTGAVQALAAAPGGRGGAWTADGMILFTALPGNAPILRMPAAGGQPTPIVKEGRFPQLLPDGRHFIYFVPQAFAPESRGMWVARLDGSNARRLEDADAAAVYAAPGYLLFVRQGALLAQAFDPSTLTLTGNAFSLAAGMAVNEPPLVAALSASPAGTIVYRSGSAGGMKQVAWFDRSGRQLEKIGVPFSNMRSPSMAPDLSRVAFHRTVSGNSDIWLLDVRRGILSRSTSDPAGDFYPVWSPNGDRLMFNRKGDLYRKPANGAGAEELVLSTPTAKNPTSWSRDGRFVLSFTSEPNPSLDIWVLPLSGDTKPFPVVETSFDERYGQFSPDGRWIAFESNESGRVEVYVQPFPGPGNRVQISSNGGAMARWRNDGRELFYIGLDEQLMAVPIQQQAGTIEAGAPVPLFRTRSGGAQQANSGPQYEVAPDGQRFLVNTVAEEVPSPITVILNWRPDGDTRSN